MSIPVVPLFLVSLALALDELWTGNDTAEARKRHPRLWLPTTAGSSTSSSLSHIIAWICRSCITTPHGEGALYGDALYVSGHVSAASESLTLQPR